MYLPRLAQIFTLNTLNGVKTMKLTAQNNAQGQQSCKKTCAKIDIANFRGHGKIDIGQFYLDFFI